MNVDAILAESKDLKNQDDLCNKVVVSKMLSDNMSLWDIPAENVKPDDVSAICGVKLVVNDALPDDMAVAMHNNKIIKIFRVEGINGDSKQRSKTK